MTWNGGLRIANILAGAALCSPLAAADLQPVQNAGDTAGKIVSPATMSDTQNAAPSRISVDDQPEAEIIVNAQKRSERIQDVPIAITVVSANALDRSRAKNLIELQGLVPGVFFAGNAIGGSAPITIRGVAGVNTYLLDDPVALYVNDVYQSSGQFGSTGFLDVESIEIVRGPQGTLQGRNATGGAVLIRTTNPTSKRSGFARASLAAPFEVRGEAAMGGPLAPNLQIRIAANFYNERGWGYNVFDKSHVGGGHGHAFRGTIRWQPVDNLDVRLIIGSNHTYSEPALARFAATIVNPSPNGPLQPPGTLTPTTPLSKAQQRAIEYDLQFALNRHTFSRITNDSVVLDATFDLGASELVSITGYDRITNTSQTDIDSIARTDREGLVVGNVPTRNVSQELRLQSSGTPRLSYIVGLYFAHSDQDLDATSFNLRLTNSVPISARFVASQKVASYAGFADATMQLTDRLSAIAGVRYTRETKSFTLSREVLNAETGAPLASLADYRPPQAAFSNTSIRAKLVYKPTYQSLLYASFSTGFKSGGFNAFGVDPAFRPETLKSLEVGMKASFLEKRVNVAFAAYANRYDDMQVRYGIVGAGLGIANAANSRINGFELEGTAYLIDNLSIGGTASYVNGRFIDFKNALDLLSRPVDASNNRLPRSPTWQYSIYGSYTPRLADNFVGVMNVSWQYRSLIYLYQTDQASPTVQGKAVGELGVRVGITLEREKLTATIFATNLNNGRSANGLNVAFSYPSVTFNKPRSIGLQIERRF